MEASFSKDLAHPGEVINLRLHFSLQKGARLPDRPSITGLEKLTVISTRITSDGVTLKLMVDTLDTLHVPSLTLKFIDADNQEREMASDPTQLTVTPAIEDPPDNLDMRPIKGIMLVNRGLWRTWIPYALIALAALLAFGIWRIVKRGKGEKGEIERLTPPDIAALKALDDLNRSGLIEMGQIKAYYFSLSEIMRIYMEKVRPFPAYELTTDEIAACIDNDEDRKLVRLLRQTDLVKFAEARPTLAQKEEHWLQARQYVEDTRTRSENDGILKPAEER